MYFSSDAAETKTSNRVLMVLKDVMNKDHTDKSLFDVWVMVDWSASSKPSSSKPSKDAIWLGIAFKNESIQTHYVRTRREAKLFLLNFLQECIESTLRVFVGWDFGFGYPRGFSSYFQSEPSLEKTHAPWLAFWKFLHESIEDSVSNQNNRFEVANAINQSMGCSLFWGRPRSQNFSHLHPRAPKFPLTSGKMNLERQRLTEKRLKGTQETWKLLGVGSVGSQSLMGIPVVYSLRFHQGLESISGIWPFETEFERQLARFRVIHAEIWPGVVRESVNASLLTEPSAIRDRFQVIEMCRWFGQKNKEGRLIDYFRVTQGIDSACELACRNEEGWILGAL